jgi:hypothetical protein
MFQLRVAGALGFKTTFLGLRKGSLLSTAQKIEVFDPSFYFIKPLIIIITALYKYSLLVINTERARELRFHVFKLEACL